MAEESEEPKTDGKERYVRTGVIEIYVVIACFAASSEKGKLLCALRPHDISHTMAFFESASDIHASHSTFNGVGHDQTNISCNIYVGPVSIEHNHAALLHHSDAGSPLQEHSDTSSQGIVLRPTFRSAASDDRHIAARLIVEIVQSLMASDASNQFHDLKKDLNTLQQTLDLTGLAIEAYQCTPLGRLLTNTIGKETEQCIGVLRELLSAIRAYQRDLGSTRVIFSWSRGSGSGYELGQIRNWREKLSACQKSLGECLHVLDSYVLLFLYISTSLKYNLLR